MVSKLIGLLLAGAALTAASAQTSVGERILPPPAAPGKAVEKFVKIAAPVVALRHVRVIDGTGAKPLLDRTVVIEGGKIAAVLGPRDKIPAGAAQFDMTGRSLLPGLVGMHNHLFYIAFPGLDETGRSEAPGPLVPQMTFSAPRLYLAGGVTTIRTAASVEPYIDLNVKRRIDAGLIPGPHMDVTAPYLEGAAGPFLHMHPLSDAEHARRTVAFWADQGFTSFKAYTNISRAQLKAAIEEVHKRGMKLTGHLCSITYPEAAALGIDNLEHGFWTNTQNDPGKEPDRCPSTNGAPTLASMDADSPEARALIRDLVKARVAITSTLAVFEPASPNYRPLPARALEVLSPQARADYLTLPA